MLHRNVTYRELRMLMDGIGQKTQHVCSDYRTTPFGKPPSHTKQNTNLEEGPHAHKHCRVMVFTTSQFYSVLSLSRDRIGIETPSGTDTLSFLPSRMFLFPLTYFLLLDVKFFENAYSHTTVFKILI